jgi:hypothetical protein
MIPLGENPEEARQREFEEHVCASHPREDFSQAAARIVREATEKV